MQHGRLHHVRGEVRVTLRYLYRQKQIVSTAPLSINTVIGEVRGLLHSDAVIKNVAVELDLTEGLSPILGDRVQLQQVLLNLIMNGFDAMEGVPTPERILVIRTAQEAGSLVRVSICIVRNRSSRPRPCLSTRSSARSGAFYTAMR